MRTRKRKNFPSTTRTKSPPDASRALCCLLQPVKFILEQFRHRLPFRADDAEEAKRLRLPIADLVDVIRSDIEDIMPSVYIAGLAESTPTATAIPSYDPFLPSVTLVNRNPLRSLSAMPPQNCHLTRG